MSAWYATINGVPRLGSGVPLIARAAELNQLRGALDRAGDGSPSALLVAADAGVGKSRLLSEFIRLAADSGAGAIVLTGRCLGVGDAGLPYLPFAEIVRQLRSDHPDVVAKRQALLSLDSSTPTPDDGGAGADRADTDQRVGQLQLFDAFLGALADLSGTRTVVVAIEDLHWADPSTRSLLSFLAARLGRQRLLIVATYRTDDLHRTHPLRPLLAELVRLPAVERLDLRPFGPDDANSFVRAVADGALDEQAVRSVAQRSEGNAFFAEELLVAGAVSDGTIPTALADVLLTRLEALSPAAQRVARAVSVTGRSHVRHSTLSAVLDLPDGELEAAIRDAVQHHVLVPSDVADDAYTFRHALLREAIYADLLPGERVRLHRAYAEFIARNKPQLKAAEGLAYHAMHSNDLPTALHASVQAAENARQLGAPVYELRYVEQALGLWEAVDDPASKAGVSELSLLRQAAYAATAAGQPERALAFVKAARRAADEQDDLVLAADVRRQQAQVLIANGKFDKAEDAVDEAWTLIKGQPASKERAWVLSMLARRALYNDEHGTLRELAEQAISDARESGSGGAEADALITLAFADTRDGLDEESARRLRQAADRAAEVQAYEVELRAMFNLATNYYDLGRLDEAAAVTDTAVRRASDVGLTWSTYGLQVRWMRAMAHYARGDWNQAAEAAAQPTEQVADSISALIAASAGLVHAGRGEFAVAERLLEQARGEWDRDDQIAQLAAVAGAEIACWQDRPDDAAELLDEAIATIRKVTDAELPMSGIRLNALAIAAQADRAQRARAAGDGATEAAAVTKGCAHAADAERIADEGIPRTATLGPEGRAWRAKAQAELSRLLADHEVQPWHEVIEAFGYGEIYQQAMARLRLAAVLLNTGDRDAAAAELTTAIETARALEARPLLEACLSLASRARLDVAGARPPVADTLTPRETAVLRLVADGRTNRQIGEQLYISGKTVSVHVSRVMAKLGAGSRTEAVSIAYQRGLLDT